PALVITYGTLNSPSTRSVHRAVSSPITIGRLCRPTCDACMSAHMLCRGSPCDVNLSPLCVLRGEAFREVGLRALRGFVIGRRSNLVQRPDHRLAEHWHVIRLSRRDQIAILDDRLVHVEPPGILDIDGDRRPAG